jgi:hypothetical protein
MGYAGGLIEKVLGIWIAAWAFRRKYELDQKLDRGMQTLRWAVVFAGFALAEIPGSKAAWARLSGGFTALAFLCWPNFACHVTRLFRREGNRGEP